MTVAVNESLIAHLNIPEILALDLCIERSMNVQINRQFSATRY